MFKGGSLEKEIIFIREKDFKFIRRLSDGGCATTLLIEDEYINEQFVCKKYQPEDLSRKQELFEKFVNEVKILHKLYHKNIVRIFNHYLYPEKKAGYIIMEYVDGTTLDEYLKKNPQKINIVFKQLIEGFTYLELNNILHRDIRPYNIMIDKDDIVKIIDFGFGKHIQDNDDYQKSISINWWCDKPADFKDQQYDFRTEIYFVGKLIEKSIKSAKITTFKHQELLNQMILHEPEYRIDKFQLINDELFKKDSIDITEFTETEMSMYRSLSTLLSESISSIEFGCELIGDHKELVEKLKDLHTRVQLEEYIPKITLFLSCFVMGSYRYKNSQRMKVEKLKEFIRFFTSLSNDKLRVVLINITTLISSIETYTPDFADDLPF